MDHKLWKQRGRHAHRVTLLCMVAAHNVHLEAPFVLSKRSFPSFFSRVYKERLGVPPKVVIGYQSHADTATKSGSTTKNKFVAWRPSRLRRRQQRRFFVLSHQCSRAEVASFLFSVPLHQSLSWTARLHGANVALEFWELFVVFVKVYPMSTTQFSHFSL